MNEPRQRAWQELVAVLQKAREYLAIPGNDFAWSSWQDQTAALAEIDSLISAINCGQRPNLLSISVLFAPTGPIQEVSLSSGWADQFLAIAAAYDAVEAKISATRI